MRTTGKKENNMRGRRKKKEKDPGKREIKIDFNVAGLNNGYIILGIYKGIWYNWNDGNQNRRKVIKYNKRTYEGKRRGKVKGKIGRK